MDITIKVPKEWEEEFGNDKFAELFERVLADLKDTKCLVGNYELETLNMLKNAFHEGVSVEEPMSVEAPAEEMKSVSIFAHPYCDVSGEIQVPERTVNAGKTEVIEYVNEHFGDVKFGEPDFDYRGTDYDIEDDVNGYYPSCDE